MKRFLLISLLIYFTGCDQPKMARTGGYMDPFKATGEAGLTSNTFEPTDDTQALGAGYESCNNFATKRSTLTYIKNISVCRNTSQNNYSSSLEVKVKFGDQDYVYGTCFVPMTKYGTGSSTYVGLAQCTYHTQNQVLTGELIKNRPGFESNAINAVMVLKKNSVDAYFECMDGFAKFMATGSVNYNNSNQTCSFVQSTNCGVYGQGTAQSYICQQCLYQAEQYKNTACNEFSNNHEFLEWNL